MSYKIYLSDNSKYVVSNDYNLTLFHKDNMSDIIHVNVKDYDNKTYRDYRLCDFVGGKYNKLSFFTEKIQDSKALDRVRFKYVEDVEVGDMVMGMDFTPRTVQKLHTGFEDMYEICVGWFRRFRVNKSHLLELVNEEGEHKTVPMLIYLANKKDYDNWYIARIHKDGKRDLYKTRVHSKDYERYYGFELDQDNLFLDAYGYLHHNSGKSVVQHSIIAHASRYPDKIQMVGIDIKMVEFSLIRGVKGINAVALEHSGAAEMIEAMYNIMQERYAFMATEKVNNVYNLKEGKIVDYYEVFGQKFQFDEIIEVWNDFDESHPNYEELKKPYPNLRYPRIMTMATLYEEMQKDKNDFRNPQLNIVKGYNTYIDKDSIKKTQGEFKIKAIILLIDELNQLMNVQNYKIISKAKTYMEQISGLGRAAGVHMIMAMQQLNRDSMSSYIDTNTQARIVLGTFKSFASEQILGRDVSEMSKAHPGRGFYNSGNNITEFQSYLTIAKEAWNFDDNRLDSYTNPYFLEHMELQKQEVDKSGFVDQHPLDQEHNKKQYNINLRF